jgi:nucleotide-binding universal stress UspA family protein
MTADAGRSSRAEGPQPKYVRRTSTADSGGTVEPMEPHACVIVGVDTSAESLAALDWGLRLGSDLDARVVAVHAVGLLEGGHLRPHPDLDAIVHRARAHARTGDHVVVEAIMEDGPPADVISRVAIREHATVVVVGSRGLGQATRLLGSTSEAVLANAAVPVLIVPAGCSPEH